MSLSPHSFAASGLNVSDGIMWLFVHKRAECMHYRVIQCNSGDLSLSGQEWTLHIFHLLAVEMDSLRIHHM